MNNNIKISILVTYHAEEKYLVKPLLTSLDFQKNIDFNSIEILINNDTDSTLLNDYINDFENIRNITKIYNVNFCGIGPSRQFLIDNAKGDFVLFCDSDDNLFSNNTLSLIMSNINGEADIYSYNMLWEGHDENNILAHGIIRENAYSSCCKLIKREFLVKNSIRFSPDILGIGEDMYFCTLLLAHNPIIKHTDSLIYVYTSNRNSVCKYKPKNASELTWISKKVFEDLSKIADIQKDFTDKTDVYLRNFCYNHSVVWLSDIERTHIEYIAKQFTLNYAPQLVEKANLNYNQDDFLLFIHTILNDSKLNKIYCFKIDSDTELSQFIVSLDSLLQANPINPIICLIGCGVSNITFGNLLVKLPIILIKDFNWANDNTTNSIITNLNKLTQFEKIVYLPNNIYATQDINELFDLPGGNVINRKNDKNIIIVEPNQENNLSYINTEKYIVNNIDTQTYNDIIDKYVQLYPKISNKLYKISY